MVENNLMNVGLGLANNAEQYQRYEILAIDNTRIQLRGPNPCSMSFTRSAENAGWPLDPEDPSSGRLIFTSEFCAVPVGAVIRFVNGALRARPLVKKIEPPVSTAATVDFFIEATCDCTGGDEPWDLAFPPGDGKYYLDLVWYQLFPEGWPNLQTQKETQFTATTNTVSKAQLEAVSGVWELLDTAGERTRIIYPEMFTGSPVMSVVVVDDGASTALTDAEILERLTTTQMGAGSWNTTLDLSDYLTATLEEVRIAYRPQATPLDDVRLPFPAHCANCQRDLSGSYIHGTECHCTDITASEFGTFQDDCWQPDCDRFCLGYPNDDSAYNESNMSNPPANLRESKWWADIWTRCSWVRYQGVAGSSAYRNFALSRPTNGGPSFEEILGSFQDTLPVGLFASAISHYGATAGELVVETSPETGAQTARLRHGAFWRQGSTYDTQDAAALTTGLIADEVAGWAHTDPRGEAHATLAQYPSGCGVCPLYSWGVEGNWLGCRSALIPDSASYISGISTGAAEDATLAAEIRERFE